MAILFMTLANVNAQDVFGKGTIATNVSIGLGSYNYYGYKVGIPPLSVAVDAGIIDNLIGDNGSIGIGGYVGFATYSYTYNYYADYYYKASMTRMCLGVRGTFHYQLTDRLDTYAGLMLGMYTYSWRYTDNYDDYYNDYYRNTNSTSFAFSPFVGTRYYMSSNFGFNAEIGYGFTYISAGITLGF